MRGGLLSEESANVPVRNYVDEYISKTALYLKGLRLRGRLFPSPALFLLFLCFVTAVMFSTSCRSGDS